MNNREKNKRSFYIRRNKYCKKFLLGNLCRQLLQTKSPFILKCILLLQKVFVSIVRRTIFINLQPKKKKAMFRSEICTVASKSYSFFQWKLYCNIKNSIWCWKYLCQKFIRGQDNYLLSLAKNAEKRSAFKILTMANLAG